MCSALHPPPTHTPIQPKINTHIRHHRIWYFQLFYDYGHIIFRLSSVVSNSSFSIDGIGPKRKIYLLVLCVDIIRILVSLKSDWIWCQAKLKVRLNFGGIQFRETRLQRVSDQIWALSQISLFASLTKFQIQRKYEQKQKHFLEWTNKF